MSDNDIFVRVSKVISNVLDKKQEDIKASSSLRDDLSADSLDSIEMIMELEEEFGIEIGDNLESDIVTVSDLVSHVERILTPS
ncbi:MAG: acyl carrier protein [Zetaproteobacteria bacterium]|nr:MAG: acyl carrier protein [Zetaproteobacteria bacterium]